MFSIVGAIFSTLALLLSWLHIFDWRRLKPGVKRLPGPRGYPLLGNILDIGKYPEKQFDKWRIQYGDIYQVNAANYTNVVLSDPNAVKEIMNDVRTNGRLMPWAALYVDTPYLGIFHSEGELWAVHRRFVIRQLREFGFGKSSMESLLMDEVKGLIQFWRESCGKPVGEIRETMRLAVVNGLWSIVSGHRFELTDQTLKDFADNTTKKLDDVIGRGAILLFIPWIRHILPGLSGYTNLRGVFEENKAFFEKSIREHQERFDGAEINDFIDVYLAEMKKDENKPESQFYGQLAVRQLVTILFDMFIAGTDTTAMSSAWAILYLCKFPRVQEKLQAEILKVTDGDTRHITLSDRPNMPYATAVVDEVYRYSSIAGFGLPHKALEDFEFRGYFIPKDAQIVANMFHIHHSTQLWGDPQNFRPERFLSADGQQFERSEYVLPFQTGRRICPGETLARDNIFLYLTNLFQAFSMSFDPDRSEPGFEAPPGFLRAPYPYQVIMTDRRPKYDR